VINASEVQTVTILKNSAATDLYGSAAQNGVVIVTTKGGGYYGNWGKKKLNNAKYNNYAVKTYYSKQITDIYYTKQFYIPKYEGSNLPKERKDFRKTIYWNPVVQTDENGIAELEFYNSDAITSFKVVTEGIGYNGLLGRQEKDYSTEKLLSVDFKSPNYMVINDSIQLPITITNTSDSDIKAFIALDLPEELKTLKELKDSIFISANSSVIKEVLVKPIKKANRSKIGVELLSQNDSDYIQKDISVLSPYFPTQVSISDSRSKSFDFSIDNAVANSVTAEFTVYTDIVGDVMDGIESLIREPWGCFEQVSSSTYPNILVLKYLQETNKSNPEIEKKALDFIKKGYKKLAGYETRKNGFEWYGKAPPHEALSAYGLMEFTEMKEVFDGVSEAMLERTIEYLLSRRNGQGGFEQNRGKYGFSGAPENVNNAYIVYALSESGITTPIIDEYEATYQEALKSNDTYRMALMACASYNFDELDNAEKLVDRIKRNIDSYSFSDLPVDNTITRSYGNAKNIETVAFVVLTLLRQTTKDDFLISQGIEYLIGKRRYNRFGSTQSTSMALKALIEYTKNQKDKFLSKDASFELVLNGHRINKKLKITPNGKITVDSLGAYIKEGVQTCTMRFSNKELTLPYSLNVVYDSFLPDSSVESPLSFETLVKDDLYSVGDNVSMSIKVANTKNENLGMVTAVVGIPSGTTPSPSQLKKLTEENKVAYYEIFDNYLVFYWRSFRANEVKSIRLDLKADIPGNYKAPASTAYLYYGDEFKTWIPGTSVIILR
jgi:TonB-dependent SusC/RagA subfamily outer membrane receptor